MAGKRQPKQWVEHGQTRRLGDLKPHPKNSRTHSKDQIAQIAASMAEWDWTTPILIDEEGTVLAGHGRRLAGLSKFGEDVEVPISIAHGWSDEKKRAYVIADNRIAELAGWDEELLQSEIAALDASGFNLELTGYSLDDFAAPAANYSRKIVSPVYTVTGEAPAVEDLIDETKTKQLIAEIEAADLPDEIAEFLRKSAERHTVFKFSKIAEFYARATPEVQDLMERSALVIIDYNKAIEGGFVRLTKYLASIADDQGSL